MLLETFLDFSVRKLKQLEERIEASLDKLSYDQIWWRGADEQNAVGNLILHLCGNLRQWIRHGVVGEADVRQRDAEFSARGGPDKDELIKRLREAVEGATEGIRSVTAAHAERRLRIQKYDLSVIEAIYHVVEHFGQHTGQIIYATKLLTSSDLGFYKHLEQQHKEQTP